MDDLAILASTVGDLLKRDAPSDHVAVSVTISARCRRHPAMKVPISAHLCKSVEFASSVAGMLPLAMRAADCFAQLEAIKCVFRHAAEKATAELAARHALPGSVSAIAALRALRAGQKGDAVALRKAARVEPELAPFLGPGEASVEDVAGLLDYARDRILEANEAEAQAIIASSAPEAQRKQRAASVRARGLHWRLRRPKKRFVGLVSDGFVAT